MFGQKSADLRCMRIGGSCGGTFEDRALQRALPKVIYAKFQQQVSITTAAAGVCDLLASASYKDARARAL